MRADDLVVRVFDMKDAVAVINFINENFSDQIMQTNPFLIKKEKVGLAADHNLSFNSELAGQIAKYIATEAPEDVSMRGFQKHLEDFRTGILQNSEALDNLLSERRKKIGRREPYINEAKYVYNVLSVIDLMIMSVDENMKLENFERYWENLHNISQSKKQKGEIERLVKKNFIEELKRNQASQNKTEAVKPAEMPQRGSEKNIFEQVYGLIYDCVGQMEAERYPMLKQRLQSKNSEQSDIYKCILEENGIKLPSGFSCLALNSKSIEGIVYPYYLAYRELDEMDFVTKDDYEEISENMSLKMFKKSKNLIDEYGEEFYKKISSNDYLIDIISKVKDVATPAELADLIAKDVFGIERSTRIKTTEIGKSVLTGANAVDGVQMQTAKDVIDRNMVNQLKRGKEEGAVDGK